VTWSGSFRQIAWVAKRPFVIARAWEEILVAAGQIVGGVGLAVGTGGIGAVAGVGVAMRGAQNLMNLNRNVQQNIEGQISADQTENAELMQFSRAGRETAVGGFRRAQMAGAPELSGMMMGGAGRGFQLANGMSLRDSAVASNLTQAQLEQSMGTLAGGMGGSFLDEANPRLMGNMQGISGLLRAQGVGLSNAPEIASSMFQGGMDRGSSLETTRQMFEDAVASGLDKAEAGRALTRMGERAAGMGLGGAGAAKLELQQELAFAQRRGASEGPEAEFEMGVMRTMRDSTKAEGGIGAVAGLRATQAFGKKHGLKMGAVDELEMQRFGGDPEGMRKMLTRMGRPDLAENANELARQFQDQRAESMSGEMTKHFGAEADNSPWPR
jgi:hypothetical protein